MKTTTLQLLPTTSFGTPSGNYDGSSLDWSGDPQQAADYYGGFGTLQTVAIFLNLFQGLIKIEASLDTTPTSDSQWFKVYEFDSTDSTATTNNFSINITGNFTWIRTNVEGFDGGSIEKIMMSY
jgi:hypothetical protein